jgi:IPT/TIG domain
MRLAGIVALAVLAATCSSPTKPGPVIVDFVIQSVSPATGPASGGTEVTIRGTGFATGATISIGGRPATDVTVRAADVIAAKTPASTIAGPVDVVVSLNGQTKTLTGGFRYEPTAPNSAPVIGSMTAQGRRVRQPAAYADYGETIQISVAVQDAESTPAQLVYQWRACDGTFVGSGPQVDWTAPIGGTLPSTCTIEVTITDGPHVAARSIVIRLHNSVVEVGALALEFLTEFADSTIPAVTTVRNFSDSCPGKKDELDQVTENRITRFINSHIYGAQTVTVAFGGVCRTKTSDACVIMPAEWNSTVKASGLIEIAKGTSYISGVYRDSRWWLCDSLYQGSSSLGLRFMD